MIRLVLTCGACPEQYDAFDGEVTVGYLRLRHGRFTVQFPDVGGELIYGACPIGDGVFMDDERDYFLRFAVDAIQRRVAAERDSALVRRLGDEARAKVRALAHAVRLGEMLASAWEQVTAESTPPAPDVQYELVRS